MLRAPLPAACSVFPLGNISQFSCGSRISHWGGDGGRRPPTQALFSETVCENERIGSRWEAAITNLYLVYDSYIILDT